MTAALAPTSTSLDRVMLRLDAWRRPVGTSAGTPVAADYKEWMHFCVRLPGAPGGHLLVNFNITAAPSAADQGRAPRVIALGALDGWSGSVESFAPGEVSGPAGGLDVRMGPTRLRWSEGAFFLSLRTEPIAAELRLRPLGLPTVSSNVSLGPEHAINWVVLPRLEATGWVRVGQRRLALAGALAYHDHNWGRFRWGSELAWEWGVVSPDDERCPWTAVFARVSDGRRRRTLSQTLLLWRQGTLERTFQDREIESTAAGHPRRSRPFTLPGIASLLAPGAATGVPARLSLDAGGLGDRVRLDLESEHVARVAIPSEVDPFRLVLLNEVCGRARVTGTVRGRAVDCAGAAVMEFVRG